MSPAALLELARDVVGARVARHKLRACAVVGASPRVRGDVWIHGEGKIIVGDRVFFDASGAPIELYPWAGASIVIGDDSYLGGGTSIEATSSITLGARARLGSFCKLMDNHFHPVVGDRHARPAPRPVVLEDDVTLGPRTIVLAGARIETGAHIEAGSVIKAPKRTSIGASTAAAPAVPQDEQHVDGLFLARELSRIAVLMTTDRKAAYARIARGKGVIRAAFLFHRCERGELVNAFGHVRVVADGRIRVGDRVQFAGGMISTEIVCRAGAELLVGARTLVNYGVSIEAVRSVRIGERCMFGSMVRIRDSSAEGVAPVVIGDDVWLAHGAIVEPGVTIGRGSIVAAGGVVLCDVPAHHLAFGNPAKVVPLVGVPAQCV